MLENLLKAKKITYEQYQEFLLFAQSDAGRAWLNRKIMQTFMETPAEEYGKTEMFVFMDGRRSVLRELKATIDMIYSLLEKDNYDGTSDNNEPGINLNIPAGNLTEHDIPNFNL